MAATGGRAVGLRSGPGCLAGKRFRVRLDPARKDDHRAARLGGDPSGNAAEKHRSLWAVAPRTADEQVEPVGGGDQEGHRILDAHALSTRSFAPARRASASASVRATLPSGVSA